jgi:hypothetical protein
MSKFPQFISYGIVFLNGSRGKNNMLELGHQEKDLILNANGFCLHVTIRKGTRE